MPDDTSLHIVEELDFLRRVIIRLRGALPFADAPEVQAILQEVIAGAEDRLALLHAAKLRDAGYRPPIPE